MSADSTLPSLEMHQHSHSTRAGLREPDPSRRHAPPVVARGDQPRPGEDIMSAHSDVDPVVEPPSVREQPPHMSRRSVLRGAAGVGAVGLAAATGVGAVVAAARPRTKAATSATAARPANPGSLVVYLRDAATGELEVFAGTSKVRFRDPAL